MNEQITENERRPKRKHNRLGEFHYGSGYSYFITVCTKDRARILSDITVGEDIILPQTKVNLTNYGQIVENALLSIPNYYEGASIDEYVIMPNHIHFILTIRNNGRMISSPTMSTIVGQFKRASSKSAGFSLWQRSFYDHVIRNRQDYEETRKYIFENPQNWEKDELFSIES
ncbi:MAG: transposase [Clostridia bacterium]|nr:transposase [Clostridia bacterium]